MQKNEAQISRFALLGKAPILWKKNFWKKKKKLFTAYLCR